MTASLPRLWRLDRRQLAILLIVILLHIALVALFIWLSPPNSAVKLAARDLISFNVLPDAPVVKEPETKPKAKAGAKPKPSTQPPVKPAEAPPKPFDLGLMPAVDIRNLPNYRNEQTQGQAQAGPGPDSTTSVGPGAGPNGEPLYNAEWQREPTNAELAYYVPRGAPPNSVALIACRTAPRNLVEDCVELGETPRGSGVARAMVNAAWQFRVKPPRKGGDAMVGAWVRIRISFSERSAGG